MNKKAEETFKELQDILSKLKTVDEFLHKGKIFKIRPKTQNARRHELVKRNKKTRERERNHVGGKDFAIRRCSNKKFNGHNIKHNENIENKSKYQLLIKLPSNGVKNRPKPQAVKKKRTRKNNNLLIGNKDVPGNLCKKMLNIDHRQIATTHYDSEFGFVPPCFEFSSSEVEAKPLDWNNELNTSQVNHNKSHQHIRATKVAISSMEVKKENSAKTGELKKIDANINHVSDNVKPDCLYGIKTDKTALDVNDRQSMPEAKLGRDSAADSSSEDKETKRENCAKPNLVIEEEKIASTCCTKAIDDECSVTAREINENGRKLLNCNSDVSLSSTCTGENNHFQSATCDATKTSNTCKERQIDEITDGRNSLDRTNVLIERLDSISDQNSEAMDTVAGNRTSESSQSSFRKSIETVDNNFNKITTSINTKRQESISPDEGFVYSPVEIVEDAPTLPKELKMPEVEERGADVASKSHIQIMIKGGTPRMSKSKKRSSKHLKSGRHHRTTPKLVETTGSDKGNEVVIKSDHSNVSPDAGARAIKKKYRPHKSSKLSDRAVARNVVKNAMIENTLAKKTKPVWVEITKEKSASKMNYSHKMKDIKRVRSSDQKTKPTKSHHKNVTDWSKLSENNRRTRLSNVTELKVVKNGAIFETSQKECKNEGRRRKQVDHVGTSQTNTTNLRSINEQMKKLDLHHQVEKPRTLRHRNKNAENRNTSRKNPIIFEKNGVEMARKTKYRSASVDSSVRDLSYSSSSSLSQVSSSNNSSTSSGTSGTHSATSSVSSLYSSSSALSTSYSSSSSTPRSVLEKIDHRIKPRRDRDVPNKSEEKQIHTTHSTEHFEKSGYHGKTKLRVEKVKPSQRVASFEIMKERHSRQVDHKSTRKMAIEEEQEFEVNLERRRKRTNKCPIENDEKKDPQKDNWQHQRLVMTSQRPGVPAFRGPEKIKQTPEAFQTSTKQKSFEASAKDSSGAVLTIRDLYSLHHVLSDTQNGTVIAGHRRSDGMRVAIKRIAKSGTTRWGWMNGKVVPLELALICQVNEVRHPGVVEIVEWHETTEAFLLVMVRPHPSIDLYDHVTKQKRLKESVARRIVRQLILALLHCHKMGVLHRDVKLENILYNPTTVETILIDFGCGDYHRSGTYKEFAGTPEYYPPEWFLYKQYEGDSATVWSVGVLLYSLLCGTLPFRSSKDIINKDLTKYPSEISRSAKHLITQAVQKKPRERIELKFLLDHPWFKSSKEQSVHRKISV